MHDIRLIREDPAAFDAAMARRGIAGASAPLLALDEARRAAIHAAETARAEQNAASKRVGEARAAGRRGGVRAAPRRGRPKKAEIADQEARAREQDSELVEQLMALPNALALDVPEGADETDNIELKRHLDTPRMPHAREHYDIPAAQGGMDFETAAKLSGSRFVLMSGQIARLHRALAQFMLDTHTTENGLDRDQSRPVLVSDEAMHGTGQLPKFGEDSYRTTNGWWLIPTAEVTLTNIVAGADHRRELPAPPLRRPHALLPLRGGLGGQGHRRHAPPAPVREGGDGLGHPSRCLRGRAAAHAGLRRRHPRAPRSALPRGQALRRRYRLRRPRAPSTSRSGCRARTATARSRRSPICWDFQARRMNARYRPSDGGKPQFVHTLNGSGLAVGRALIAVLENGQLPDGTVELPAALWPYMGGVESLSGP